jgi:phenylacetate-CoA ligase
MLTDGIAPDVSAVAARAVPAGRRDAYPVLERLSSDELQALQLRRLNRQLERLWQNTFYADAWAAAGLARGTLARSLDDLRRFPLVTKEDLLSDQEAHPPYGRRLAVDPRHVFEITLSSGTSGRTQEIHAHTARDAHMRAMHGIAFRWAGMGKDDVLVFHVGISNSASHGPFHRGVRALGRLPYLVGHLGFEKRLELMQRLGMDHMYVMPSALNGLTQLIDEQGTTPHELFPGLRSIMMSGEGWPVDFVERMEEAWGARVFEGYGASQTYAGFIMSSCEHGAVTDGRRNGMHVYGWAAVVEVVDPETLEPVGPGEVGEVVVTHLEKEASPLIRFRTRDRAVFLPWQQCSCGRQLDMVESGTIGRWDDMVKIKGENVFPPEVDEIVFARPEIGEYQGRVFIGDLGRDAAEVRLALVGDAPPPDRLLDDLRAELKRRTNVTFELRVVPVSELPRWTTPDVKPRRWTDDRQANLAAGGTGR